MSQVPITSISSNNLALDHQTYHWIRCAIPSRIHLRLNPGKSYFIRRFSLAGSVRDISIGGLGIILGHVPFGTLMLNYGARIVLKRKGMADLTLPGRVVRSEVRENNSCIVGIQFEQPLFEVLASLTSYSSVDVTLLPPK